MKLNWKNFCDLHNIKNTQKAEPMICDDCIHNTVCRLDGNEMLEWCSTRVPITDIVEVKHGEWIELPNGWDGIDEYLRFECSNCRREVFSNFPYCPYCGADMRGEENERSA